jgi:antitoxin component YwqK of YwqJK toxin-antitoxin module
MKLKKTTTMKKIMILAALVISAMTFAQDKTPRLEQEGQLVKATYLYDNGQIQQEGFFKDGKLVGIWVSYDENGVKKAIGEYVNGQKIGKWLFWNEKTLSEVDYSDSRIASIKNWKQEALVNRN